MAGTQRLFYTASFRCWGWEEGTLFRAEEVLSSEVRVAEGGVG